jgi:2-aminoadipate transaminase
MNNPTSPSNAEFIPSERAKMAGGAAIGKLMAQALAMPDLISLAAGFVDNATLPCDAARSIFETLANDETQLRKALQYDSTAGSVSLRDALADWSYDAYPEAKPEIERMMITAGSNQFLHLLVEALINPGDIVIVAAPTYFVFLGTLRGVGAKVVGVPADANGLRIDALNAELERIEAAGEAARLKAIYVITDFDNPAGSTLSLDRRQALIETVLRWRREHGPLTLISDNAYQQLRYDGESLPPFLSIAPETRDFVIELGTFSKSFSPGVRVGWGVLPEAMVPCLLDMKSNIDFGSPNFAQSMLKQALIQGLIDQHLPVIKSAYRQKRDAMVNALEQEFAGIDGVSWHNPDGGLYVWLKLPDHVDASEGGALWNAAIDNGVLYVPGHHCFPEHGTAVARNSMRLSFGVQSEERIREGISKLAHAFQSAALDPDLAAIAKSEC